MNAKALNKGASLLLERLSKETSPIKAKDLKDLYQFMGDLRKTHLVCSKPGPKGGFYLSTCKNDINLCNVWINNWRQSMGIRQSFKL